MAVSSWNSGKSDFSGSRPVVVFQTIGIIVCCSGGVISVFCLSRRGAHNSISVAVSCMMEIRPSGPM
jgi:hypothetical protein